MLSLLKDTNFVFINILFKSNNWQGKKFSKTKNETNYWDLIKKFQNLHNQGENYFSNNTQKKNVKNIN